MQDYTGRTVGNYLLEKRLGDGGMAQVYKARHIYLDTLHAIKILHPDMLKIEDVRKRFLDEAKIQAKLQHPNIVAVTDIIAEPGIAALVVEYVEGMSLAECINKEPVDAVQFNAIKRIFIQLLNGLQFVHDNGIIHRDIKPDNILITLDNNGLPLQAKLLDFGIAKLLAGDGDDKAKVGTPHYMSPEQILSPSTVDIRSDIFSLGVTLYETLTGRMPFEGEEPDTVQRNIVQYNYIKINDGIAAAVVNKALRRMPSGRYQNCVEFRNAIINEWSSATGVVRSAMRHEFPPPKKTPPPVEKKKEQTELPWYKYPALLVANAGCTLFAIVAVGLAGIAVSEVGIWTLLLSFIAIGLSVFVIIAPWNALFNFFITGVFHLDGGPFGTEKPSRPNWTDYNSVADWLFSVFIFGIVFIICIYNL